MGVVSVGARIRIITWRIVVAHGDRRRFKKAKNFCCCFVILKFSMILGMTRILVICNCNIVKIYKIKVPLSYPTATFGVPLGAWGRLLLILRCVYRRTCKEFLDFISARVRAYI